MVILLFKVLQIQIVSVHGACKYRLCERLAKQSSDLKMPMGKFFALKGHWIASPTARKDDIYIPRERYRLTKRIIK